MTVCLLLRLVSLLFLATCLSNGLWLASLGDFGGRGPNGVSSEIQMNLVGAAAIGCVLWVAAPWLDDLAARQPGKAPLDAMRLQTVLVRTVGLGLLAFNGPRYVGKGLDGTAAGFARFLLEVGGAIVLLLLAEPLARAMVRGDRTPKD